MFKTILFPLDHSREAREAAQMVADLVTIHQSKLILLSVVETPPNDDKDDSDPAPPHGMASPEDVAKLLRGAKALFSQKGIETDVIEREGMPSFTICDVADEVNADLIVMGCRGLGLTAEGASESVTSRVINLSPCPVLVVP
jgi:nucleotide-binding universal stress UspA family protein